MKQLLSKRLWGFIRITSGTTTETIPVTLRVFAPAPVARSIEPAVIPVASEETIAIVTGAGFLPGAVAHVGPALLATTFVDANTLRVVLPKHFFASELAIPITVTNPSSQPSGSVLVTVGPAIPQIPFGGVVNAASYAAGPLSAGEIVTVFGAHFGDNPRVLFDGIQARLIYASPQQLSVTVPYEAVRAAATSMVVEAEGRRSTPSVLALIHAHLGLFTADASGKGQGAILNQDASVNGPANPAERGSIIVLYGTGGGPLTNEELPRLALPVKVFIDGVESEVLYAGIAPGLVSGAIQINVRVPESATQGEIVLRAGDVESQAVTVALR